MNKVGLSLKYPGGFPSGHKTERDNGKMTPQAIILAVQSEGRGRMTKEGASIRASPLGVGSFVPLKTTETRNEGADSR